jgi:hypothetical protein
MQFSWMSLDFVLKVKSKRRYYYLEAFNNFDAFGTPYQYLEGAEGYSIATMRPIAIIVLPYLRRILMITGKRGLYDQF